MRLQLALNVRNLEEAVDFYTRLFDTPPRKRKPGYANFAIEKPPLKLVLFENPEAAERINHLGVEVFDLSRGVVDFVHIEVVGALAAPARVTDKRGVIAVFPARAVPDGPIAAVFIGGTPQLDLLL